MTRARNAHSKTRPPARANTQAPGSPDHPAWLCERAGAVLLLLKIQPRASKDAVQGELGDRLRIRLTAPPVDSKANQALVTFLAELLGCPRNRVALVRGHTSREKTVAVRGVSARDVIRALTR